MVSVALTLLAHAMLLSLHLSNGSFPRPLSAKEERECVARMLEGDMDARNTLIEHNLRLVAHVVKKYYTRTEEQDDLVSIGTIGLIKGISSYRPEKGTRLATYAAKCIENAILTQRNNRRLRLACSFAMYYCCAFRCFTAASTSSSVCSVEQGSFWIDFSACSDWNFASSRPSSCCACFDLGKIRNTSTAALPSRAFSASLYVRFPMHMQSMKTANLCTQVKNTRGEELPGLSFTRGLI